MSKLPDVSQDFLPFDGGYDTETSPWQVPAGMVREAQNYEVGIRGGYQDIQGYERFDGRTAPSAATYAILHVVITGAFSDGDTVTQLTSGATAVVVAVSVSSSPQYLVLTKVTGTFDATHDLQVSAVTQGTSASAAITGGASTPALHATYLALAADEYRGDINKPSGSGAILGVWNLSGVWYCARNNAGGSAAVVFKETSSGWASVALGREVAFTSGGTYPIAEGNTITGAISGATAVITRVVLSDGSWAAGDAEGRLIFASQTGTFQAENLNVGATLNVATIAGNSSAITLAPDGRFETVNFNFGGAAGYERVYGCDGENRAFEFDGTVWVPITTGMADDTPSHISAHKNHLFLSFGPSVQHSGVGDPYSWSPITGAAEINVGEPVTGFAVEPGDGTQAALGIYGRNRISVLYGTSSSDWQLIRLRVEVGAYAHTIQQVGQTLFLDDRGLSNLRTAQDYGNFQDATLTNHIQRWLTVRKGLAIASCAVREKNQYRLFFSDASALYVTFDNAAMRGMMPVLFSTDVACCKAVELADGTEEILFGSSDGYVYQMDRGTSFDGDNIDAFIAMHFHSSKSVRVLKKYLNATMEARGSGYSEFYFSFELAYADVNKSQPGQTLGSMSFADRFWDSGLWDAGFWDGVTLAPSRFRLSGSGENISLIVRKSSDKFQPITFSGAMLRLLPRRGIR
jgi:hypothetical protein